MKILGDLLDKCGRAIRAQDSPAFAQATADLAARLVAAGYGVIDGELGARVKATTEGLRRLLTTAAMPGADARTKEKVNSIGLACANADVCGTKFGYPPVPGDGPDPYARKGRKRGTARRSPSVENGGGAPTGGREGGAP